MRTPLGNLSSRISLFTTLDVSSASTFNNFRSVFRHAVDRFNPSRRTCCKMVETVMTRGLTTASTPIEVTRPE